MRAPRALPPCGGLPTFAMTSSTLIGFLRVFASFATVVRKFALYCSAAVSLRFGRVLVATIDPLLLALGTQCATNRRSMLLAVGAVAILAGLWFLQSGS